jgi:hypothetical protein
MARGRHAKPSGLLSRLFPRRTSRREAARQQRTLLRQVADELHHLRGLVDAQAAAAALAEQRARLAEEQAAEARVATAALRVEVARLREELLWAWAEGRLPAASLTDGLAEAPTGVPGETVIDLREATGS